VARANAPLKDSNRRSGQAWVGLRPQPISFQRSALERRFGRSASPALYARDAERPAMRPNAERWDETKTVGRTKRSAVPAIQNSPGIDLPELRRYRSLLPAYRFFNRQLTSPLWRKQLVRSLGLVSSQFAANVAGQQLQIELFVLTASGKVKHDTSGRREDDQHHVQSDV